ncbi:MAG: spore coat protein [Clostridia bacterium]|nr:spore coat protein [Clostridia bacterium]MCD8308981.1 spore coat protein [Clostridia bacterium]
MAETITAKELSMISQALTCEGLICKKARMYANTLTDAALAECMAGIACEHEARYNALLAQLG